MSLLTPPSTSHRRSKDKENTRDVDPNSRISWAENDRIHILQLAGPSAVSFKVSTAASSTKRPPTKSILKKCQELAPWPQEKQREVTPEPADPMVDCKYLVYPVTTILDATETTELRTLIEAYSVLTARLRAAVTSATDTDASWPLFDPLRKHTEKFTEAVVRDLGKALVDPGSTQVQEEPVRVLLPSPKNTPQKKKKRDGMNEEQIKYARDLCTTTHAVIRLLSLVFTLPSITNVFTHAQQRSILTAVLAIPLANELPTPNSRKTWALAIWLLQTQRLSAPVLSPAADRIALALCRGIDGELGKEGKKGSASDGLRAIHDLSIHLPSVFIPAFTHSLLPSVLTSLLAPTLALRTSAANALGGFVIGATSLANASIHSEISRIVFKYMTTLPPLRANPPSPIKSPLRISGSTPQTPTKPREPSIVKTLKSTLATIDPTNVANGPVWAICVLSALLVLLGPAAMRVPHLRVLLPMGLRHKNSNVRALTSVMWRCILWVYVCPPLITVDHDGEEEVDSDMSEQEMEKEVKMRDEWWKLVASVVEMETGICAIAATIGSGNPGVPLFEPSQWVDARLSQEEREEQPLRRALEVLTAMANKDAATRSSAIDTMRALVGVPPPRSVNVQSAMRHEPEERTLLPRALFSAIPGLLTTGYGALRAPVTAVFDETPKAEDVRDLTKLEVGKEWVWEGLVRAWRAAVACAQKGDGQTERTALLRVWEGMVSIGLAAALDPYDEDADRDIDSDVTPRSQATEQAAEFTQRATDVIIIHVLEDADLNLQPPSSLSNGGGLTRTGSRGLEIPGFSSSSKSSVAKLLLAQDMWTVICRVVPHSMLGSAAENLVQCLLKNVGDFTTFMHSVSQGPSRDTVEEEEEDQEMNEAWAELCVDVLAACGLDTVREFWDGGKWKAVERALIWRVFTKGWVMQSSEAGWEGAVCALAVPFRGTETWVLTAEDVDVWQKLLDYAVAASLDYGHDSNTVLGSITGLVDQDGYVPAQIRLVEFVLQYLVGNAVKGELRELPDTVLDFVSKTMKAAYPPSRDQTIYQWAARAIFSLVDECPRELLNVLGESLSAGLAVWIADVEDKWNMDVIEDILPVYDILLATLQVRPSLRLLDTFSMVLAAPLAYETRTEIREPAVKAFKDYWDATYANTEAPTGGWPTEIATCLTLVYSNPAEDKEALLAELEAAFTPRPSTPTPPTPAGDIYSIPSTPCSSSSLICLDRTVPNTPSTPPRPSKSTRPFTQHLLRSPESPMHSSSSRLSALARPPTPRTSRFSPVKRRKLVDGNKENLSPIKEGIIPSVVERIFAVSPKVNLGKRRFEEDDHETDGSEDERSVVENLVRPTSSEVEDVFFVGSNRSPVEQAASILTANHRPALRSSMKKRKRMIMDFVEVPSLPSVYRGLRPSASLDPASPLITDVRSSLRRTSSEPKSREAWSDPRSNKRRKGNGDGGSDADMSDLIVAPFSTPVDNKAAYYPYNLARKHTGQPVPSSELSSDDDPRLGQVTPYHLISPELKRSGLRRINGEDPPSDDDSVLGSSPSKALLKRKLKRMDSASTVIV